ncbi:MAG: ATP-dependent DNA helicase UvrD2 [Acidimicrobiales bacterium]
MEGQNNGSGRARLLEGLTEAQRHAVCVEAAPLCILAGPGSGKTRVLTRRIAWRISEGSADASHVLALTFTRKAAGELRRRLADLGVRDQVAAGTFHSVAYAQLRQRWADRGEPAPSLLERKAGLLGRLTGAGRAGTAASRARLLSEVAGEIEWARARLVSPSTYPAAAADAGRKPALPTPELAELYAAYEAEKHRRRLVDFDDLLSQCATALEADPAFAAGQRWRFRHLFVDEYQDVNPSQERLLRAWLGERIDLCVVGDPRQAIYGWNGADPTALANLPRRHPGTAVVSLDDNWRSSPQVLAAASAVLAHGRAPHSGATLRAHRPDGPIPSVVAYESDRAEASGIARGLRLAHAPGRTWSHMAVLVRTNAQLVLIEEALQRSGIPHRVRGGQAFLAQPEIRDALAALGRQGPRQFSAVLADLVVGAREAGSRSASDAPPEDIADDTGANLATLAQLAQEFASLAPSASLAGFEAWLSMTIGADGAGRSRDAVELATFHRAKGLEWLTVFVAGLEQGLVPIGQANTPAAQAEEQRLLYVALTRAEVDLHCSWAKTRTFGPRCVRRAPSPYLEAIEAACAAPEGQRRTSSATGIGELLEPGRRHLSEVAPAFDAAVPAERPAITLARAADADVLEALRSWRSATARASGVPAYIILHDATLAAVAAAMPDSVEELTSLPGLGPVKGARYGPALLDVVANHRRESA